MAGKPRKTARRPSTPELENAAPRPAAAGLTQAGLTQAPLAQAEVELARQAVRALQIDVPVLRWQIDGRSITLWLYGGAVVEYEQSVEKLQV